MSLTAEGTHPMERILQRALSNITADFSSPMDSSCCAVVQNPPKQSLTHPFSHLLGWRKFLPRTLLLLRRWTGRGTHDLLNQAPHSRIYSGLLQTPVSLGARNGSKHTVLPLKKSGTFVADDVFSWFSPSLVGNEIGVSGLEYLHSFNMNQ